MLQALFRGPGFGEAEFLRLPESDLDFGSIRKGGTGDNLPTVPGGLPSAVAGNQGYSNPAPLLTGGPRLTRPFFLVPFV